MWVVSAYIGNKNGDGYASADADAPGRTSETSLPSPVSDTTVTQNTPDVKNSKRNRNETDTQSALRAQAEETVRAVMESYPANVQEARVTAVAQSLRETGETALADEVIRVWQDAGGDNVVYYAKKAAENAAETEDAGYGREGETGGVRVREGRERNDGQSAGGSSGSVEGGTGRTAAADARRNVSAGQSKSRRVAERIARGGGQSTRAATGLSNASANNRYQVYALEEQDMDAEAYIILNDAERNGYRAHLYYKGLYFTLKNGKTVRMDGARAGEDLYIRMDAENFSGEQIANHEMFHALAEGNPGLVDAIMQDIMSEYTEEELEELVQYYTDLYRGVTDDVKKILGELCADAYAGMDRANVETGKQHYARLSEKSGAVRRMTERRTGLRAIGERGVAETRAGPASMQNAPANAEAGEYSLVSIDGKYYTPTDEELIDAHDTIRVVRVEGAKYQPGVTLSEAEYSQYREEQSRKFRETFGVYTNRDSAYSDTYGIINAEIGTKTLRKARSNGGVALFDILPKLGEIFENAIVLNTKADRKLDTNIKGIVNLVGCADLGNGNIAIIKLNVKEYVNNTAKVYGNKIVEIEKLTVLAGVGHSKTSASTSYAVSFEPILQRYRDSVKSENAEAEEFSMGGEKAKTADIAALEQAKELQKQGMNAEDIFRQTGWYTGADGKWRFEVDDSGMKITKEYLLLTDGEYLLRDIVSHDELFKAYPQLGDMKVKVSFLNMEQKGIAGLYDAKTDTIILNRAIYLPDNSILDLLVHEIQHKIQRIEGLSRGSSPEYWRKRGISEDEYNKFKNATRMKMEREMRSLGESERSDMRRYFELDKQVADALSNAAELSGKEDFEGAAEILDRIDETEREHDELYKKLYGKDWFNRITDLQNQMDVSDNLYTVFYHNTAGEIEARDVTERRTLTAEERRNRMPNTGDENTVFAEDSRESAEYIGKTRDGRRVYKTDFAEGTTETEKIEAFKKRIASVFNLGMVVLNTDVKKIEIKGDRYTEQKNIYGDISLPEGKLNALYDMADILKNSVFVPPAKKEPSYQNKNVKPKNDAHKNVKYWYKFKTNIVMDGIGYEVTFNIRDKGKEQYSYLIEFKEDGTSTASNTAVKDLLRSTETSHLVDIISKADKNVNTESEAEDFSLASGQSFEQVEERIDELEGLMENLLSEREEMDPAEFNVRWFNYEMEKGALESELFDRRQAEERQRLREEAKARQALAEELNPKIEARRAKAREYEREAKAAEQRYEKTKDAGELEEAKRLRDRAAKERRAANEMQKQLRGEVKVKNAQRVYRPDMAIRRTQDRILDLFHIQAGSRGEAKQALTGILLDAMKTGYVGQETLETVLRQMYRTGIEVVPAPEIYQDIANTLKGRKIYVSGEVKAAYGDDWNRVRGQLLGAGIYTTSDRAEMGVDSVYAELAGQYPGVFDEENADMRGMLDELLEAAQLGKAQHRTLSESAAEQGHDSEEDFWNLYRLTSEELARFADAAGVESRVRSAKEWQIAQQQEESSAKQKKILKASRERAGEIRRQEQGKRQAMLARRQRTEMMDRLRRQITRLNRKAEQNDALLTKALRNLDEGTVSLARQAMETVDLISNGFRKSTQKDLLALRESIGLAKQDNPDFEEDALEILKNALQEKAEYRDMEAGKFDQRAKARLDQALNALDRLGKRQLTDMNIDDLNAMADAVEAIVHEIDNLDKMLGELWDANVDETANRIREEVGRAKGISRSANNSKARGKARHLLVEQSLSPSRMLARLVGYDRSGAMGNVIREFEQGDLRSMQYALDADLIFGSFLKDRENQKWLRRATGKNAELITLELPLVMEYGEGDAPVYDPEATTTVQVSQMMLVQMALDLENEANIRHAERGGYTFPNVDAMRKENREAMYTGAKVVKMPREVIARIVQENLSGEGQAFARLLHRYYNGTSKTAINETSQMLHGVDVARVKNYYPIHMNDDYRGQEYNVFDATLESMGSLKERQQGAVAPILLEDAAETFRWHRDNMAKYVGYAVARRNFVALLNHRNAGGVTLRAEIEQKWGNTAGDSIDEFFRILETGKLEEVSDVLSGLQSKYAGAVLSFNVGSMMKQLGALPLAGSTVGHGAILRGLLNPKLGRKQREFIRKYTPYLDYRGKGYTYREIAEAAGKGIQSERVYKTLDYLTGRNWLEAMDIKVNTSLWHAAEYAVRRDTALRPGSQADIEAGVDPYYKAVADVFNRMTHDTQTNYNLMSRPPVLMRKGAVIRAATMFRTDAYQTAGVLRESIGAYAQAVRNRKAAKTDEARAQCEEKSRKAGQTVARSIAGVIGNSMISVIVDELRQLLHGNDEDYFDEEGNFRWGNAAAKVGQKVLMNVAGCFTFVEEIAEYLEAKIKGERYYEPEISRLGMLLDGAESLWKFGETVWNIVRDANELRENGGDVEAYLRREADAIFDCTKDMIEKLSFLLGIPLKNMERTITTALGWILPEAGIAYQDLFRTYGKSDLKELREDELPYGIRAYLKDQSGITDEAVSEEYLRLYQLYGGDVLPGKDAPEKIREGEEKRETTITERGRWYSKYYETMMDETQKLIESKAYQSLTDREKADALQRIEQFAEQAANDRIGVEAGKWVQLTRKEGASPSNMAVYLSATAEMKEGEPYVWLGNSNFGKREAMDILDVVMQDKDEETGEYAYTDGHEQMKLAVQNGLTIAEWAELYSLGAGKVKSFNKLVEQGVSAETAMETIGLTAGLEPEEGKENVSNMQKYEAIAGSSLSKEEQIAAIGAIMGNEMKTESGAPSQYAKMLDVIKTGASVTEYLEIKKTDSVDGYLKCVDTGLDRKTAAKVAQAVSAMPSLPYGESYSQKDRQTAAVAACSTAKDQILAYAAYGSRENEKTTIAKFTAAASYSVTPELYLEVVKKVSSGYDADQNGTISQKELRKALDSMKNLTQNQKAALYQLFDVGWKTNPYGNTKDIREAYQKAKGK